MVLADNGARHRGGERRQRSEGKSRCGGGGGSWQRGMATKAAAAGGESPVFMETEFSCALVSWQGWHEGGRAGSLISIRENRHI